MCTGRQADHPVLSPRFISVQGSFLLVSTGFILLWFFLAVPLACSRPSPSRGRAASSSGQVDSLSQAASLEARGAAAYQSGRFKEAEPLLEEAVRLNPGSARAHALLGLTLARRDNLTDALRNLQQAHGIEPANPDYAYDYAVLLLQARCFAAAATILESLRTASPESADVIVNLARAYAGAGDFAELSALVSDLPSPAYSNQELLKALVGILAGAKRTEDVERLWSLAIQHDPNQPLPYAALAEFWNARGQARRALTVLDGAPAAAHGPVYLYVWGQTQLALQNYAEAGRSFEELTRLAPENERAWAELIHSRLLADDLAGAQAAVEDAMKAFPAALEFQYQHAVVNYMLDRSAAAMQDLAPLLQGGAGDDPRPVLLMAVLQSQSGNYQEATRYFALLARRAPGCNSLASYFYGATLLRMHRPQEAAVKLQAAIHCHPHFALAEYRLGQALSENGKLEDALVALQQSTRDAPSLAEPYYAIAQIRRRLGDVAGAAAALAQFNSARQHVDDTGRSLIRDEKYTPGETSQGKNNKGKF
jgi:predicted Zn-dependent protease